MAREPPRGVSIQTKMLAIILPLIAVPMLLLAAVGFVTTSREAAKSSSRYLSQREADLRAVAENPGIASYFNNTRYGLSEEADVARRELEQYLARFVERSNSSDRVYLQARYIDQRGVEVAKVANGEIRSDRGSAADAPFFAAVRELPPDGRYLSPEAAEMTVAMPVFRVREPEAPTFMGAVALDFAYPIQEFKKTTAVILRTFALIAAVSLTVALLLTVLGVRQVTHSIRRLAEAANRIAAGERSIRVTPTSRDEIGQLATAFNAMTARLEADEAALRRKVGETATLYEVAQKISAQVDLAPTLQLIVDSARDLLEADVSLLALRQGETDEFVTRAASGTVPEAVASLHVRAGEGLIGRVAQSGQPIVVEDYPKELRNSPFRELVEDAKLHSHVAVPLRARGAVTGVLLVTSAAVSRFGEADRQLLSALADHASVAIENARLFEQVRRHAEELEERVETRTRELQEANRRLQEASRHKSEFLANMSHELRTPLNAIIGFTRLVMRRTREVLPEKQYENLEKILISSDHLLQLINGILDLSKIEAGRMEVRPTAVDLHQLVGSCLRTVEPLVKSDRLQLVVDLPDELPVLLTDEEKLTQILINLLSNAIKFTEAGTVTISARCRGDTISIAVSDTGIGIAQEALELIFEEFRQIDSSSTRRYGGTGLGLSITRHFARLLQGEVGVQSVVGAGSTFTVTIPIRYRVAVVTHADGAPAPEGVFDNHPVVLVIDDDPDVVYLFQENLTEAGYRVVGALSAEEGVRKARELKPFAITLDIIMPGTDGWAVLRQIKADPATRDIPVLVVSVVDHKDRGYQLGAFDYLLKPLERDAILAALARIQRTRGLILVVDDDPTVADLVRQLLEGEPYQITAAADGVHALELIQGLQPDVVLLDLLMPAMNGFELIDRMKADPQLRQIPVLVLTAKDLTLAERSALEQDTRGVIEKLGLSREMLVGELTAALHSHRPAQLQR
jgi:signal transduction histidine kinase/DNA-binding response OmpR family regulator